MCLTTILILILILILGASEGSAHAETSITSQAVADDGAFLPYAPAPMQRAGLCLVDTGVNLNPDTETVVVDRTAIDGGSGDDLSTSSHGTIMAMMAGAPLNGWGMVGTAPGTIQIVSVRILEPGQSTFPFTAYAEGLTICLQLRKKYDIRVINLSLGTTEIPSNQNYETVANAVQEAHNYGVAVLAAAGNDDGGPISYPAAYPGVLSVGASDTQTNELCAFSNRGEGLSMIAPGCDLDGADPITGVSTHNYLQGTSEASDIDSAALTSLNSYRPDLSIEASVEDLTSAHDGVLDIAQAFRNAGLGWIVTLGEAAEPKVPQASSTPSTPVSVQNVALLTSMASNATMFTTLFPRPKLSLRRSRGRSTLVLTGRPSEARVQVRYLVHTHARRLTVLRVISGLFTRITVPASAVELKARYTDPFDTQRASPWTVLMIPKARPSLPARESP